ncbi:MAG: hypothetical protein QS2022_4700 [Candidatus Phytoplasma asteris]|uniref:Predicted amino acid transporter n=1 Tax='Chrysanthemum coronarium' phytoplasma TaxID=1520703 RepID=A0ABQ0J3N2_9MOLU|nr:hypothetical protein ['Chrysanthemum coronarium' phytoplasma]TKA87918.1 MAG: hypothetical protein PLY_4650 [Periwinkle leaf yellowing phytoplasma]WEX19714.1 MAG: hypothetical protein QS2022_4700 [Candidatus Phytoplasma asteris]GAK74195.1 predicted amino acid transporter ['Chrysanthemum coronarium' phytoplasma]
MQNLHTNLSQKAHKSKEDQTTLKNDLEHHYINFKSRHDEIMSLLEALFPNVKKQTQTEKDILQLNNQNIESTNQNQRAQNNKEREISAEQTSVQQKTSQTKRTRKNKKCNTTNTRNKRNISRTLNFRTPRIRISSSFQ